jgi:hypothetical protein
MRSSIRLKSTGISASASTVSGLEQLGKIRDVMTGLGTKHVESVEDVGESHALCADLLEEVVELAAFLARCVLDHLDEGE